MEYANASLYDGGTAIYEAMMMAVRKTGRTRIVVSETSTRSTAACSTATPPISIWSWSPSPTSCGTDMDGLAAALDGQTAVLIVQNPDFLGNVLDYTALFAEAARLGIVTIASVYPILQSVLKTPGEMGADIAVAEGQSLGLPLSFGGPYLGIMTCRGTLVRQMPGRIVGRTKDRPGPDRLRADPAGKGAAYPAPEGHLQHLLQPGPVRAASLIYMSLLGPEGCGVRPCSPSTAPITQPTA
jgi:glycine dehydrogenase subunit 1